MMSVEWGFHLRITVSASALSLIMVDKAVKTSTKLKGYIY